MKSTNLITLVLFILIGCTVNKNEEYEKKSESVLDTTKKAKEINQIEQSVSLDPDTSLAYFLYNFGNQKKFDDSFEEYSRWDLENTKIKKLMRSIFSFDLRINEKIDSLQSIRNDFVIHVRMNVLDDYSKLHVITGMPFDFLVERKDSLVKPLIAKALKDPSVPEDEKILLRELKF